MGVETRPASLLACVDSWRKLDLPCRRQVEMILCLARVFGRNSSVEEGIADKRSLGTVLAALSALETGTWTQQADSLATSVGRCRYFDDGRKMLGLAPLEAQEGDFVCIIEGNSVPLMLRKGPSFTYTQPVYTLVGECYLENVELAGMTIMNGNFASQCKWEETWIE